MCVGVLSGGFDRGGIGDGPQVWVTFQILWTKVQCVQGRENDELSTVERRPPLSGNPPPWDTSSDVGCSFRLQRSVIWTKPRWVGAGSLLFSFLVRNGLREGHCFISLRQGLIVGL